ncbi:hypothetical protein [Yoonia sp.]|uniref:hypothetical protein n=1 Tax=Yoonia sp. TaxID=2212373 RepID=UPI002E04B1BB|nr:hypothetical protein [Yoonia sp.]
MTGLDEFSVLSDVVSIGLLLGIFWKMGRFTAWMDQAETRLKRIEQTAKEIAQ